MLVWRASQTFRFFQPKIRAIHDQKPSEGTSLKKKGKGDEEIYFSKIENDQKGLVNKQEVAEEEPEIAIENDKEAISKFLTLLDKHNIRPSESLIEDILNWKKGIY
ncbi:unnamed protein product [Blepharisma stoltei]|uniref:Uncharacterized protein n=1 Tax=Blepharisma stoltei TaxID=1481888 RepID=A0AAU9JRN9_9CILI|nr:unnamed protein product [Blepharisma stoltei]